MGGGRGEGAESGPTVSPAGYCWQPGVGICYQTSLCEAAQVVTTKQLAGWHTSCSQLQAKLLRAYLQPEQLRQLQAPGVCHVPWPCVPAAADELLLLLCRVRSKLKADHIQPSTTVLAKCVGEVCVQQ